MGTNDDKCEPSNYQEINRGIQTLTRITLKQYQNKYNEYPSDRMSLKRG